MSKPNILPVERYLAWGQDPLVQVSEINRISEEDENDIFFVEDDPNIRAIVTRGELEADEKLIATRPALEQIAVYGVGYDAVDPDASRARNIRVTNTPDALKQDVADLGFTIMLYQSCRMIINMSRRSSIGEDALINALSSCTLEAVLDVFEGEPALDPMFLTLCNVLLQSRHTSDTIETRNPLGKLALGPLSAHSAGPDLPTPVL